MTNVVPMYHRVEPEDLMTTGETARLLRRSIPTVRALTIRPWHPLPYINTGSAAKKQRVFHRPSILRWIEEEIEATRQPEKPPAPVDNRMRKSANIA